MTAKNLNRVTLFIALAHWTACTEAGEHTAAVQQALHPAAAGGKLLALLECVESEASGTLRAHWGYSNPNRASVTRKLGGDNQFHPNPKDRGQPRRFEPGKHSRVFSTSFDPRTRLTWQLDGRKVVASASSPRCSGGSAGAGGGTAGHAGSDPGPGGDCYQRLGVDRGDAFSVRGTMGELGPVDYTHWGYSAGGSGPDGMQRFTNTFFGFTGTPTNISGSGIWAWTNQPEVEIGKTYVLGNARLDFVVDYELDQRRVTCTGTPSGSFSYTRFSPTISATSPVEGSFEFSCPESGIDVRGCFRFIN